MESNKTAHSKRRQRPGHLLAVACALTMVVILVSVGRFDLGTQKVHQQIDSDTYRYLPLMSRMLHAPMHAVVERTGARQANITDVPTNTSVFHRKQHLRTTYHASLYPSLTSHVSAHVTTTNVGKSSASLLVAMCSPTFSSSRAGPRDVAQESEYAYTLGTSFTTPFIPTHDTDMYRLPRVSNGPLGAPLPRVAVLPTRHSGGIELANMCADRDDPLRVTLLLSRDSTEHLDDGGLAAEQALRRQVDELMRPVANTSREAIITVIVDDDDNGGGKAEGMRRYRVAVVRYSTRALPVPNVTGMGRREQELAKLSWLFDAPHTVEVVVPPSTRIALPSSREADAAAQVRASTAGGRRSALLAEIARHASPTSSATSRALLTMPPHFVFEMPAGAVFRGRNLAALCRYEPVANDESEARAVYPYAAAPFAYKGGAERLPLGFVLPAASAWARGVTVAGTSPPLVVVSSCRPPVRVVAPAVDSRHYSKGGDVVLRGAARMVYVREADAFIPFFGGVHEDVILGRAGASAEGDGAAMAMSLGAREALFAMRRPLGSRCSSDPADPTRVITHVPCFIDEKRFGTFSGREFRVFVRVLLATALMTAYSDVVITTKVSSALAQAAIRGTARGVPPSQLAAHKLTSLDTEKCSSFKNNGADNATLADLDYCYPNLYGELVIVDYSLSSGNKRHVIAGLSQHQMFAGKGFYDIVRYTEQDLYITRDQFLLYCSTLPYMEMRNFYINFLRFEFNSSIIDGFEHVRDDPYDVRHAYSPSAYFFVDAERTFKPSQWHFASVPEALLIQRSHGANQTTDGARLSGQGYRQFEVVPGYRPKEFCSFSQFSRAASLPAVPSVLNSSNVHNWRDVHPLVPTEQYDKSYSLEGCYVMAKPMHSMFKPSRVPRLYNGMWIVPDERLSTYFSGPVRSYLDQTSYHSGDREAVAYFNAPVIFYGAGVVLMRPYPRTADSSPNTTHHNTRYIVDRLSLIHHGGNRYYRDIGNQLSFPIFDNVDPTPWRDP